jgi:hypothetical protein
LLAVSVVSCSDLVSGPGTTSPERATLSLAPRFSAAAQRALALLAAAAYDVQIDRVRVVIVRPPTDTIKDTTVVFPVDQDQLSVSIPVAAAPGTTLDADLYYKVGENLVLFHGRTRVTVQAPGSPGNTTPEIVIDFVGPGAAATSLAISPAGGTFSSVAPITFTHQVFQGTTSLAGVPVAWSTSDETVATISTAGVLTFTGKRGTVDVIAQIATPLTTRATLTFVPPPSQLAVIGGGGQSGPVGSLLAQPFVVEVRATDGAPVAGQAVTFSSSNGAVSPSSAVTGADGRAQTVMTLGTVVGSTTFTARLGTLSASVTATGFSTAPATLTIAPAGGTITALGATLPLTASARDANGNAIADATVVWTSRTPEVASVNAGGTVLAVGNGTARIVATAGAASDSIVVTVQQVVDTVLMSRDTLRLRAAGDTGTIQATLLDRNRNLVTNQTPTYTSSDAAVATVDAAGLVTLHGDGTATITAAAGGKQATAVVLSINGNVPIGVGYASLRVTPAAVSMRVGDTLDFSAVLVKADGSTTPVTPVWATNAPGRTSIDGNGRVIAFDTVTATITATSAGIAGHSALVVLPAPVLRDFTFTPTTVSGTATAAQSTTVSVDVADAGSGISSIEVTFTAPSGATRTCSTSFPSAGSRAAGTFSCSLSIPAGGETGSWHVTSLSVVGTITRTYNESALSAYGTTTLTVNP